MKQQQHNFLYTAHVIQQQQLLVRQLSKAIVLLFNVNSKNIYCFRGKFYAKQSFVWTKSPNEASSHCECVCDGTFFYIRRHVRCTIYFYGHFVPYYSMLKIHPTGHTNLQELHCCQRQLNSIIDPREDNLFVKQWTKRKSWKKTMRIYWVIEILASNLCIFDKHDAHQSNSSE